MEFAAMTALALIALVFAVFQSRPQPQRLPVRVDRRDRRR